MIKKLLTLLATGLVLSATAAFSAPLLTLSITDPGGNLSASSGTGIAAIGVQTLGDFNVSATALGVQTQGLAGLDLQTLNVTTAGLTGPETVVVTVLQTGLTSPTTPSSFFNSFSAILKGGATSATLTTYVDPTNAGIANAGTRVATTTFTSLGSSSVNLTATGNASGTFSETEIITLVFGSGTGTITAEGVLSSVPEPGSLALMGAGLFAVAFARLRRK